MTYTGVPKSVWSLRRRTLCFLTLGLVLGTTGFVRWIQARDELVRRAARIQSALLPAGRLVDNARSEIDLQIQELTLARRDGELDAAGRRRLELRPAVRSLASLQGSPLFPAILEPLFDPWSAAVRDYRTHIAALKHEAEAIPLLKDLRSKTVLLARALDRETSVQFLEWAQLGTADTARFAWGLGLAALGTLVFLLLLRRWLQPLAAFQRWAQEPVMFGGTPLPPPSLLGTGALAPPAEIQDLNESLRAFVERLRVASEELESRRQRNSETERSTATLLAAIIHLMRHNEALLNELLKKERLASMGEMAAQLAHEIRNPLNSLNLKLELLRDDLPESQRTQLDGVLTEIDRLDSLTESHLRTARAVIQGQVAPARRKVADVVEAALQTLKPELDRKNIFVELRIDAPDARSDVPENVLKAMLLNLMKNAAEAVEGSDTRIVRLHVSRAATGRLLLAVADTGCGFPAEFLARPFESFRTTKSGGTGLGLSTSRRMGEPYGVDLAIASPAGAFATEVTISLPAPAATERPRPPEGVSP